MENLIKAIYEALSANPGIISLVPPEQIRRGWNEPSDYPTIRFTLGEVIPIGDDLSSTEIFSVSVHINILADSDLALEPISNVIINALNSKLLIRDGYTIHSVQYIGDNRGTYFDTLRKRHRKDLAFTLIYSPL